MLQAHRVADVRAAEQALMARLPDGSLMQRAAAGLAAYAARRLAAAGGVYGARVALLVGSGDNGGDALFAGARLARRGARVVGYQAGSKLHEAGAADLRRAGGTIRTADDCSDDALAAGIGGADLVLDGLLGIGGKGGLRETAARVAGFASPDRTVAVDVPSGVDADTGAVAGMAVRASATVTMGTYKPGLLVMPGADHAGTLVLIPIGLDPPQPALTALTNRDVAARLPQPGPDATKYTRGVVGVVAGSDAYPGAAVLCTGGALRGGAGYVRFVSTEHPVELVRQRYPEVVATVIEPGDGEGVLDAGRVQAWVLGPGLGTGDEGSQVVEAVLGADVPVLVDADALTVVAQHPEWLRRRYDAGLSTLLTPHEGEFARLVGGESDEVRERLAADRLAVVRETADRLGATVLLKGSATLVVEPDGRARVNRRGQPWLATAGSGDVLSGLAGSLLASGLDALDAGSVGAYLHGEAERLAVTRHGPPLVADDLPAALPAAWRAVLAREER